MVCMGRIGVSARPAAQRWEAAGRADGRAAAEPTVDRAAAIVRAELLRRAFETISAEPASDGMGWLMGWLMGGSRVGGLG